MGKIRLFRSNFPYQTWWHRPQVDVNKCSFSKRKSSDDQRLHSSEIFQFTGINRFHVGDVSGTYQSESQDGQPVVGITYAGATSTSPNMINSEADVRSGGTRDTIYPWAVRHRLFQSLHRTFHSHRCWYHEFAKGRKSSIPATLIIMNMRGRQRHLSVEEGTVSGCWRMSGPQSVGSLVVICLQQRRRITDRLSRGSELWPNFAVASQWRHATRWPCALKTCPISFYVSLPDRSSISNSQGIALSPLLYGLTIVLAFRAASVDQHQRLSGMYTGVPGADFPFPSRCSIIHPAQDLFMFGINGIMWHSGISRRQFFVRLLFRYYRIHKERLPIYPSTLGSGNLAFFWYRWWHPAVVGLPEFLSLLFQIGTRCFHNPEADEGLRETICNISDDELVSPSCLNLLWRYE